MRCSRCNSSGANMKRCKACGRVFCQTCDGGDSANRCPFCGTIGKVEIAS